MLRSNTLSDEAIYPCARAHVAGCAREQRRFNKTDSGLPLFRANTTTSTSRSCERRRVLLSEGGRNISAIKSFRWAPSGILASLRPLSRAHLRDLGKTQCATAATAQANGKTPHLLAMHQARPLEAACLNSPLTTHGHSSM